METYKIALFGHRDFSHHNELEACLYSFLRDLIQKGVYIEIYIGRNGEFDCFTASVIKRVQRGCGKENIEMNLVLPYRQKDMEAYERYYDNIIIPEILGVVHPKGAITERNKWMVEESDLLICFVEKEHGGAYNALKYANKLGKW